MSGEPFSVDVVDLNAPPAATANDWRVSVNNGVVSFEWGGEVVFKTTAPQNGAPFRAVVNFTGGLPNFGIEMIALEQG